MRIRHAAPACVLLRLLVRFIYATPLLTICWLFGVATAADGTVAGLTTILRLASRRCSSVYFERRAARGHGARRMRQISRKVWRSLASTCSISWS